MHEETYYPHHELFQNSPFQSMEDYWNLVKEFDQDYEGTWEKFAREKIDWIEPFDTVLDESNAPFYRWFVGGKMNVANQCIDRHLPQKADQTAILFEGDRGDVEHISYAQLSQRVNKMANLLKETFGITKGDRVVLYMPMIPEAAYAMLACARIGAIHSIVFGGFSAEALRDRIDDAQAKLVITADGAYRKGKPYLLKPVVDEALAQGGSSVEAVLVVRRNHEEIQWIQGRDHDYNLMIDACSDVCPFEPMESEDPLFLLYTSGSTGKPKGVQHAGAGYILWAQMTMEWVFDIREGDVHWCTADVGWITGHTYIVYGPLAAGTTTLMFEGVPTYPDAGRAWQMVQTHKVTQFYTAPTAIRLLNKLGEELPRQYDLSTLRVLGTVGEPIDPAAWKWYYEHVGGSRASIVDTYWQTETGGHIISPLPGATPVKPGYATFPLPGIKGEILEADGTPTPVGEKGFMCITRPWPSMIRTIWGDPERFRKSYFGEVSRNGQPVYFTGDGAMQDEEGYIKITGRTDDVINVSGHRIGTAEIEDAIKNVAQVAVSAVVGKPHTIKGEGIFAYLVLKEPGSIDGATLKDTVNAVLKKEIGAFALCDEVAIVPDVPKTRSGKIMRRLLRAIARGETITQDTSTLENPAIVGEIEAIVNGA